MHRRLLLAAASIAVLASCSSDPSASEPDGASGSGGSSASGAGGGGAGGKGGKGPGGSSGQGGAAGLAGSGGKAGSAQGGAGGAQGGSAGKAGQGGAAAGAGQGAGGQGGSSGKGGSGQTGGSGGQPAGGGGGASGQGQGGSGGSTSGPCEPNATLACSCGDAGAVGAQRCLADGSSWAACACSSYGLSLYVSPSGDDGAAGTLEAPWKTLAHARDAIRAIKQKGPLPAGGVVVWLRGGSYELDASLALGEQDSGEEGAPVVYRGFPGEAARVSGSKRLDLADFAPVTSASPVWSRLDASAQGKVVQINLKAHGVTDFGKLLPRGYSSGNPSALELFIDGKRAPLGRWPDADQDDAVVQPDTHGDKVVIISQGASPDVSGTYTKTGDQDGYSVFARQGLVGGKQYNLHHAHGMNGTDPWSAWFVTTTPSGYPAKGDPFFYVYTDHFGGMDGAQGATGKLMVPILSVTHGFSHMATKVSDTSFSMVENRATRWTQAKDVWVHSYFHWAWADQHLPVTGVDAATGTLTVGMVPTYGIDPSISGGPFYAYNLLEEITEPGEWVVDRDTGTLYLWPPAGEGPHELSVSVLSAPLVAMFKASRVTLQEITFEAGRERLVSIDEGEGDRLVGCTLRGAGTDAVTVSGGKGHVVDGAHVVEAGAGGVRLAGGDRPSLTAAGHVVRASRIHRFGQWNWTYSPGVRLDGVGITAEHNVIDEATHSAILYGGNNHTIALNDIHDVCSFSSDAGAIYAGRDWGARGNLIEHNFIHHIKSSLVGLGAHGIYLDDCLSGITVRGNVLYDVEGYGIEHGGGRDDMMENNVFARCGAALSTDARGPSAINDVPGDSWNLLEKLEKVGYQNEPWKSAFPACAAIPDSYDAIVADGAKWRYPEGCSFARNVGYANGSFLNDHGATSYYSAQIADNAADVANPFVDEANLDLTLVSPSSLAPGFVDIPFKSIGIKP